jgi:hypothetical protein
MRSHIKEIYTFTLFFAPRSIVELGVRSGLSLPPSFPPSLPPSPPPPFFLSLSERERERERERE